MRCSSLLKHQIKYLLYTATEPENFMYLLSILCNKTSLFPKFIKYKFVAIKCSNQITLINSLIAVTYFVLTYLYNTLD